MADSVAGGEIHGSWVSEVPCQIESLFFLETTVLALSTLGGGRMKDAVWELCFGRWEFWEFFGQ